MTNTICRICGFIYNDYYPWGKDGKTPTYDFCVCCGAEFGFDDDNMAGDGIQAYRSKWISEGANFHTPEECPIHWNPHEQLKNIPDEFV